MANNRWPISRFYVHRTHVTMERWVVGTHCDGAADLAGHVEEDGVLADDDVRHAVPVVRHGPEPAAGAHALRILFEVQHLRLT